MRCRRVASTSTADSLSWDSCDNICQLGEAACFSQLKSSTLLYRLQAGSRGSPLFYDRLSPVSQGAYLSQFFQLGMPDVVGAERDLLTIFDDGVGGDVQNYLGVARGMHAELRPISRLYRPSGYLMTS